MKEYQSEKLVLLKSIKGKIVVSEIRTTLVQGCGQVLNLFQHFVVNVKYQQAKYISLHLFHCVSHPLGKTCGHTELSFRPAFRGRHHNHN